VVRWGVLAGLVLCLADWVLIEDLGFFGGVGTDPNSMIPMALVFSSGYVATVRLPVAAEAPVVEPGPVVEPVAAEPVAPEPVPAGTGRWWDRSEPSYVFRICATVAAVGVVLLGAVPMASAATNPTADPILAEAVAGDPAQLNAPAPAFSLTDQAGQAVSLDSLRGRTVALTFLDPVCTSDCPVIAQEFKQADQQVGQPANTVFVAVSTNPVYNSPVYTSAFNQQEGLASLHNWYFLTGSAAQLQSVWNHYGIQVSVDPAGSMVAHTELAYVIDSTGKLRVVLDEDQGVGQADASSFSGLLAQQMRQVLGS
jgi:cytochrome oxidase Cu insertion factor (SCO1/SenC/PrrC family)